MNIKVIPHHHQQQQQGTTITRKNPIKLTALFIHKFDD